MSKRPEAEKTEDSAQRFQVLATENHSTRRSNWKGRASTDCRPGLLGGGEKKNHIAVPDCSAEKRRRVSGIIFDGGREPAEQPIIGEEWTAECKKKGQT